MDQIVADFVGLLVLAIVVALIARRLKLPYTIGLVITGIGLALAGNGVHATLTRDLIYLVILPPLLFEAAINLHWRELKADMLPVLVLSVAGVVISAAVVAFGMAWLLGWPLPSALVFGVLIAATDPVAVIGLFKDLGVKGRLKLLVESESLFNDGVAAVFFAMAMAWATAADGALPGAGPALWSLVAISGGGIVAGLVVGFAVILLGARTDDHLISAALTTAGAYGGFVLAEHFHFSGVLATVASGMLVGNVGLLAPGPKKSFTIAERDFAMGYWEFAAFIANSLVFLLIGTSVARTPFANLGVTALVAAILLVQLGRLLTVYPLCALFIGSRWAVPLPQQHVLWWGGLRGALGLALALSLPAGLPMADAIRIATFGVVAFSVLFQGLSMQPLMRRLGLAQ